MPYRRAGELSSELAVLEALAAKRTGLERR
jgi:hypothetical protein